MTLTAPELPDAARPQWPPWYGFAAMGIGTVLVVVAGIPLIPVAVLSAFDGFPGALALLVLILVQDVAYLGTAIWFAQRKGHIWRPWHFGLRRTDLKRAALLTVIAAVVVLGFEFVLFELIDVDEDAEDDLGPTNNFFASLALSMAVIIVAPVFEELFFRAFLYRALRNRMRRLWATLIDALVFASVHVQYLVIPEVYVAIFIFTIASCMLYEATGSILPCIALHAIFNTIATIGTDAGWAAPMLVGISVLTACAVAALKLPPRPNPAEVPA